MSYMLTLPYRYAIDNRTSYEKSGSPGSRDDTENLPGIDLAVMGCAVNGPGEASHADIGVACGDGKGVIFKKGKIIDTVKETEIETRLLEELKQMIM